MAKASNPIVDVDALRKQIRDAGLRGTGSRIAVLRLLHEARAPMTHNEVSDKLAASGYDHATIYRNLIDLSRVGLLVRTDLGDHTWRFELRQGSGDHKSQHPHFICIDCGDVNCLPDKAVSVRGAPGVPRALRRRGVVIQLQGRCDSCELAAAG
ncbi:MAG TPA: transcriptional repressor [Polyangia bacterium]|nr:transcriptional repressor [Polyangia bacterium]